MLEQFHFLQPLWFLALIPLMLIFWVSFQANTDSRAWEKVIDPQILPLLLQGEDRNRNLTPKLLLAMVWIISVIALADPVWEKVARPIFQTNAARVIVLDLSNSMLIDDLKPSRLARARFKIEDILSREEEGQTGLVLFAGEAFTAAPLTRDTETIRSMLKVLAPQIMPAQGSRADLGLLKAHELLKQSGATNGQVLLIADGISEQALGINAAQKLRKAGHTVSVMAVGTENGGKLNFRNNTSVTVALDKNALSDIAKNGGGNYHLISTSSADLKNLLSPIANNELNNAENNAQEDIQNREWKSTGPYLVLFILPFAALAFRKGWLLSICAAGFLSGLVFHPQNVYAADQAPSNTLKNAIDVLTKNKAQRVDMAFKNKHYEKVLALSDDPLSKGSAEYKLEMYDNALQQFKQAQGADARYNEGNALAKLQKYKEAIDAYDEALALNPDMTNASENKKRIEEFLNQQKEQSQEQQASNDNKENDSDSKNSQENQQSNDSKSEQNQDKQGDSETAKNKEGNQDQQSKDNQFSDANDKLEKNKEEAEQEQVESSQENSAAENAESEQKQALDKGNETEEPKEQEGQESLAKLKQAAEKLNEEEKMAAEQWLRRIPDDPGGLLKRKFRHQYNQSRRSRSTTEQPW